MSNAEGALKLVVVTIPVIYVLLFV